MPRAQLELTVPEDAWMHDVSTAHPEAVFRAVSVLSHGEGATALLEVDSPETVSVLSAVDGQSTVVDVELLWKRDETVLLQVESHDPRLLFPILEAGVPLQTPFELQDGVATWDVTTTSERLSSLGTRLEEAGIDFELAYVRSAERQADDGLLTDRQREAVLTAAEMGYYDSPRRATLTEVAEALDISKSTGSDVLHRAEGKIVMRFVDRSLADG